jgi:GH18 family chitinase
MTKARVVLAAAATLLALRADPAELPVVLTNHLGYEATGPKRAVIQGHMGDVVRSCAVEAVGGATKTATSAPKPLGPVAKWRDWSYWTVDFSGLRTEGTFRLSCAMGAGEVRSFPFEVQKQILEQHTLSDVIYYFKGQRSSGAIDAADRSVPLSGRPEQRVDAHGGWYDATGDYGKHLSHLSFSAYFNPQQLSLTAWGLLKSHELLQRRGAPDIRQYLRRLLDEGAWGADYLVRVHVPGGSFYRSVGGPGPEKRPQDRKIGRDEKGFALHTLDPRQSRPGDASASREEALYQTSFRSGAGVAIAALARAAAMKVPGERSAEYLRAAEDAWAFLAKSNTAFTNDGKENVVDDYCALLAATELRLATGKPEYKAAADERASRLLKRLSPGPRAYWRADDGDRPFFHAADAGLPVVSLLAYLDVADAAQKTAVLKALRASLEWELTVTGEVANPFGYARQLVQTTKGVRDTRFFYPHDSETAPWWQGENARLGSLATAARLAVPHFADDPAFAARLRAYAQDQLNWILGLNPFDASMLQGAGRNNPPYLYFGAHEYTNAPGGIINGITAGFDDPQGIDLNVPHTVTGGDNDWRWGEQWLPHATWYLLAVSAGGHALEPALSTGSVVIGYVFAKDKVIDPAEIAAEKLTHINYAFANIKDGLVVEGFAKDAENYKVLTGLRKRNPALKILVSVGGWTWSGGFSDVALTAEARKRFVQSAVDFVRRHDLDGFDVDWEYPGLPGYGNPHRPEDKQNFTALMTELRAALDKAGAAAGRRYLLTFAAGANVPEFLLHTEMDKVQAVVDFMNLMTYDFRESEGDPLAGHHANLYTHPADDKQLSADRAVRDYLAGGVPASKLVLGVPFYGRAWGGVAPEDGGLYQPGGQLKEELETQYGTLATEMVDRNGWQRKWDRRSQAPYLWHPEKRIFITYDDPESLRVKCRYILEHGLAGAMFWQYYSDRTGALLDTLFTECRGKAPSK